MVGHRLGEFSLTRTFRGHGRVTKRLVQKHNYMEKIAHIKYIRITPKKLRTILDDVRGKRVLEVLAQLAVTPKRTAHFFAKCNQKLFGAN